MSKEDADDMVQFLKNWIGYRKRCESDGVVDRVTIDILNRKGIEWCRENDVKLPARKRMSALIRRAYRPDREEVDDLLDLANSKRLEMFDQAHIRSEKSELVELFLWVLRMYFSLQIILWFVVMGVRGVEYIWPNIAEMLCTELSLCWRTIDTQYLQKRLLQLVLPTTLYFDGLPSFIRFLSMCGALWAVWKPVWRRATRSEN